MVSTGVVTDSATRSNRRSHTISDDHARVGGAQGRVVERSRVGAPLRHAAGAPVTCPSNGCSREGYGVRVLGVDPGLTRCGLGVVDGAGGRRVRCVAVDVVRTPADLPLPERLL